jgi:hypothetical protein
MEGRKEGKKKKKKKSTGLFHQSKEKSRQTRLQFTIKKGSSFKAFEYLNKTGGGRVCR